MIDIKEKSKCCGCTACKSACTNKAITMVEDDEGFLYPHINKEKCINCGLCDIVCPVSNPQHSRIKPKSFSIRVKDNEVLEHSTSGGFFTPLAKYVIEKNGIVYGVGYDNNLKVIHKEITTKSEIAELVGSKYVQSYLGESFGDIKEQLTEGRLVLFSGTPCQVNGLKNYLRREYDNLITMDLICHGTPSPKLWDLYKEYQEIKYKSKIKEAYFRNKTYGYHSGTMKLVFENNKEYFGSARVDYMLKSFFKEISSRPSCYDCKFKTRNHCSDFTVFDCWDISRVVPGVEDDNKGYTNLFINTQKGSELMNSFKDELIIYDSDIEKVIKYDGPMVEKCAIPHKDRAIFYKNLNEYGLKKSISKHIPVSLSDRLIEKSKSLIYKIGLMEVIKKKKSIKKKNEGEKNVQ